MSLLIDFSPREEAWISSQASEQGVPAPEIIRQLVYARLPLSEFNDCFYGFRPMSKHLQDKFAEWAIEDAMPGLCPKTLDTIAWLNDQIEEGKKATPEERILANIEIQELRRNLNANRAICGDRQI